MGWTLRCMAMELRVSPTYVHMLERAKRNPSPSLALLVRHLMKETPVILQPSDEAKDNG